MFFTLRNPRFFITTLLLVSSSLFSTKGWAQGGYTLRVDGTDDYVDCGNVPFSATMSYEAWIRTTDAKSRSDILSWGSTTTRDIVAEFRASLGKLEFGINDGGWVSLISNASINDGQWHHVAATKNGSSITLYVDGKLDNTGTVGGAPAVNQTDIGVLYNGGTREGDSYFTGDLDEIRIWSDVRSQSEIQANMHKQLSGSEDNLLAYYQMSDGSGTALTDNSVNAYTGTITNGPTWKTSGALAGPHMALDFDGSNDFFFAPLNATATSTLTVEGWFSFNSLSGQQNLINIHQTANNDIRFVPFKTTANEVALFVDDGPIAYVTTSTFTISQTNEWHHLVFIYDAGNVSIYANGKLVGSNTGQGSFSTATTNQFSLGADYNGIGAGLHANIKADEVRIWSDVRTPAEILANKDRTLNGDEANLLSYYRCDQQAASGHTTVYDYSSNGHNGTLSFMDATTDWVASAPFNTWIGSDDGDWSNGANWSRGSAPSSEDIGIYNFGLSNAPASANTSGRNVYVDAAASLSHSGNLSLTGNFYNFGTFTTTGTLTFSGSAAQTLGGSPSATTTTGTLVVNNAAGLTMGQDVITNTDLTLTSGAFSIGANTLTVNGTLTKSSGTLTGGSSSNLTIGGSGSSTGLPAVTLNNLDLNRANGVSLTGAVTVNGTLGLSNGLLNLNSQTLTIGNSGSVFGTPNASRHIIATSGILRKNFAGTGSFNYPVGDGTAYTPISLNFSSGTFSSAYADVNLTTAKHLSNSSVNHYLNRYWTVSSSGISSFSCDVNATYAETDYTGTESELTGAKWNGSAWTDLGAVNTGSNLISGTVSGFSDFTAGEPTAFPVEWLSFTALLENAEVRLDWATATEQNSDFFAIERSADGHNWQTLGQVPAAGQSDSRSDYTFRDERALIGKAQYRLRQVDLDGRYDFSNVIEIERDPLLRVYPNPTAGLLQLTLPEAGWQAELYDTQGRVVLREENVNNKLDLSDLPNGTYVLRLRSPRGQFINQSVVKK